MYRQALNSCLPVSDSDMLGLIGLHHLLQLKDILKVEFLGNVDCALLQFVNVWDKGMSLLNANKHRGTQLPWASGVLWHP